MVLFRRSTAMDYPIEDYYIDKIIGKLFTEKEVN